MPFGQVSRRVPERRQGDPGSQGFGVRPRAGGEQGDEGPFCGGSKEAFSAKSDFALTLNLS